MRTKGEKRMAQWTAAFRRWAEQGMGSITTDDEQYAYGVVMAVNVSQRKMVMPKDMDSRYSSNTLYGFDDGIALINKVVAYGDAPEGDFQDLLSAPRSDPLTG